MRKLKRAFRESGLTGKELADRTGISPSMVSRILSGERTPALPKAVRLARELGISVEHLQRSRAR